MKKREKGKGGRIYFWLAALLLLIAAGIPAGMALSGNFEKNEGQKEALALEEGTEEGTEEGGWKKEETAKAEEAAADLAVSGPPKTPLPKPEDTEGLTELKAQIEGQIAGYEGDWSVYVCDLEGREYLSLSDRPQRAASLIKLYIMGAVYQAIEEGTLEETTEIQTLLRQMITVSHNESSNELVRRLSPTGEHADGMEVVNAFAAAGGYTDTSQGRDLQDVRDTPPPGENYTSAKDCGRFLADVYRKECVSPRASEQMMILLNAQERTWKIPAGLPEGVLTANKTGELSDVENDAAVVFGKSAGAKDYILSVMTENLPDPGAAQGQIRELSERVFAYFLS